MATYKIIRYFFDDSKTVMAQGLNLEEARRWCNSPETHSLTATSDEANALTAKKGPWFDGYTAE